MADRHVPAARREQGFTLVELLVVVIVIGILAAIAVPVYLAQQRSARDASVVSDVHGTTTSVTLWSSEHTRTAVTNTADYVTAGGTIVLSGSNIINVTTSGTGDFTVCGYAPDGNPYTSSTRAFLYDSTVGRAAKSTAGCPGDGVTPAPAPTTSTPTSSTAASTPAGGSAPATPSGTSTTTSSVPTASASSTPTPTPTPTASSTPAPVDWVDCAGEGGYCSFSGTHAVRYGVAPSSYATKTLTDGTSCSNGVFGDPAYGYTKRCAYSR